MIRTFLIAAISADGFIAKNSTHMADWTSAEDKKHFSETTKRAGVVIMGANTFHTIGKALPGRVNFVYSPTPIDAPNIRITTAPPKDLLAELEREGFTEAAIIGGQYVYTAFMRAGVIDRLIITIEPVIFGLGLTLFSEPIDDSLTLEETKQLNDNSVILTYHTSHGRHHKKSNS